MSNSRLARLDSRRPAEKPSEKISQDGIEAVEIDAPGLALEEGRDFVDVDAGGLDPQQVLQRQRVAPLLERQHHFARAEPEQVIGQAGDVVAVDRGGRRGGAVVHADEADDREIGAVARRRAPRAAPARGPAPSTSTRRLKRSLPSVPRKASADRDQREHRDPHRVEQVRAPEADRREDEEDEAEQHDSRARPRPAAAPWRSASIAAPRRRRRRPRPSPPASRAAKASMLGSRSPPGSNAPVQLPQPQRPARLGRGQQQHEVDQPEQQHGIRHIMLEEADHATPVPRRGIAAPGRRPTALSPGGSVRRSDMRTVSDKFTNFR